MSILAKSDPQIPLRDHVEDVLHTGKALLACLPERLSNSLKPFLECLIFWHDLGKVQPAFQRRMYEGAGERFPFWNNLLAIGENIEIPHSLFSLAWISPRKLEDLARKMVSLLKNDWDSTPEEVLLSKAQQILLAVVAYHHWRDSIHEAVVENSTTASFYSRAKEVYSDLEGLLRDELGKIDFFADCVAWNEELAQGLAGGVSLRRYAPPPYLNEWLPERLGFSAEEAKQWILLAGALQWCDHYASAVEAGLPADLKKPLQVGLPPAELQNFLRSKGQGGREAWQLELLEGAQKASHCDDLVLVAPTGIGKTEFAFLWGAQAGRFIYTLPLRAAVHQTYERAKSYFGNGTVGLLHGDAALYLAQKKGENELSAYDSHELARHLSYAAVICTGDQLFSYAMRPPGYERIYFSALTGRLIIDEVQAYDPRAAALVVKLLEDIVSLGGSFLLITATLPPFIRKEIENILSSQNSAGKNLSGSANKEANSTSSPQPQTICQEGVIDYYNEIQHDVCRHCVQIVRYTDEELEKSPSFLDKVEGIVNGKIEPPYKPEGRPVRVLIVLNTVTQAMRVYDELKKQLSSKAEICLLHSLFTYNDRNKKEADLKATWGLNSEGKKLGQDKPQILVATQVVEAALDIDADFLLTELAPADALVQRMGRVARRFRADDASVSRPERPNVFIWARQQNSKSKLASGEGRVYDRELLELTLDRLIQGAEGSSDA
ncbi:MAG: CRISPR-associated helicase Cas3', partial [Bacteroidia bacterium]|nr:CRISPR-associated helicase Cas3' [Bacteroidia bacterium]